jgi:hypothetical protein
VGKVRIRARAVAVVAVLSMVGLLAVPTAQASQSDRPSARMAVGRLVLWPGLASHHRVVPIFGRSGWGPGRSLWRRGTLARGSLPRIAKPGPSSSSGWSIQPTPDPATVANGTLVADSCSAPGACTAVGAYADATGAAATLAERMAGGKWLTQITPAVADAADATFEGVSCASARSCMAVGFYYNQADKAVPLTEQWDGRGWKIHAAPSPAESGFFAVSCTSASACTAVGTTETARSSLPLADRWNGKTWSTQATPAQTGHLENVLYGVSCSTGTSCTAVGAYDDASGNGFPLAMDWNGTWRMQALPVPANAQGSELSAVSCTAAAACTAVGSYGTLSGNTDNLAERWNGTNWAVQTVPNPAGSTFNELLSVSCVGAKACTVGGAYASAANTAARGALRPDKANSGPVVSLAETWNGSVWQVRATPNPADIYGDGFSGLSCATASACEAVGSYGSQATNANSLSMAQSWNGSKWALQTASNPLGANGSGLTADSCVTARDCVAVGYYDKNLFFTDTLAEVWNGSKWRILPTPNAKGKDLSQFTAVSCASAHACEAVGYADEGTAGPINLAEAYNGTKWTFQKVRDPARNSGVSLNGVSCLSAESCIAVGFYRTRSGAFAAIAERWNGSSWRIQALPRVTKQPTALEGVSCYSASACVAVGYLVKAGNTEPLAERWNGRSWKVQNASHTPGGLLEAASCLTTNACTAVGQNDSATNGEELAERWNGSKWAVQKTVAPPDYQAANLPTGLVAVTCLSARACIALGQYQPDQNAAAFAEVWNGTKWRLQATKVPVLSMWAELLGLSCSAARCVAAGDTIEGGGVEVTLVETERS